MDIPKKKKIQKFKNSKKKKKHGVMIIMKKGGEKGSVRVYLRLFGLWWHLRLWPVVAAVALVMMVMMIDISRHFSGYSLNQRLKHRNFRIPKCPTEICNSYSLIIILSYKLGRRRKWWRHTGLWLLYNLYCPAWMLVTVRSEEDDRHREMGKQLNLLYGYWRGFGAMPHSHFSLHLGPTAATLPAWRLLSGRKWPFNNMTPTFSCLLQEMPPPNLALVELGLRWWV
jgi:hypothetical protein